MSINREKLNELDSHWPEVTKLAEKYGFITSAYGGVAVIATHKDQLETYGEEKYLFHQKQMFNRNMEE